MQELNDLSFFSRHNEWLRDLDAAEQELREAKTEKQIRAIQIRIKWIKHYITLTEKSL